MTEALSPRFMADLADAVAKQDLLKTEIMKEILARATGSDCFTGENHRTAELSRTDTDATAPEPEALCAAIRAKLDALWLSSTGKAKRSFEVLQPYLDQP